jgi:uncharacterized membrane protein YecN with MAPEG domain
MHPRALDRARDSPSHAANIQGETSMTNVWTDAFRMMALYVAANALIMLVLGMLVVRARVQTRTAIGDGGNATMIGAIRAHANNTENVPVPLLMMIVINSLGGPFWIIHAIGVPLTIGRIGQAIGLAGNVGPSLLRLVGMTLTWVALIVGIAACGWLSLAQASS